MKIHSIECDLFEVKCEECQVKFPKNQFKNHNCIPINRSLQILDYLEDSNKNLIQILSNFTSTHNSTNSFKPADIANFQHPIQNNDDILRQLNGLNDMSTKLTLKVEEKFNIILEAMKELKQERNIVCHICKTRKADDTCVTCNQKFCELCANKCKICEREICNNCPLKFEKCLKDCKNFLCKYCLKLINENKKFKIVDYQFEKENLCSKDVCFKSKSKGVIKSYFIGAVLLVLIIIYLYFK